MKSHFTRRAPLLAGALIMFAAGGLSATPISQAGAAPAEGMVLPLFGQVESADGQSGTFNGALANPEFSNDGQALTLDGTLSGLLVINETTVRVENQPFSGTVEPSVAGTESASDVTATTGPETSGWRAMPSAQRTTTGPEPDPGKCDVLFLDIQPIQLNLLGLELLTSRITIDANAIPGEGNLVGNLICALAGLLDGLPDTLADVTDQLNEILRQGGTAAAGGLPVSLPLDQGTFNGTLSQLEFSDQNGALLNGVLNGIADTGAGPVRVADQPVSTPVAPGVGGAIPGRQIGDNPTLPEPDPDKCDVLFLDIQPIQLNLLGLEVLTSRITVDVNAIPGEGNLAGNLVCALAGLLDGTPDAIADITDQLNQLVRELGVGSESIMAASASSEPAGSDPTEEPTDSVTSPTETTEIEAPAPTDPPTGTEPVDVEPTEPPSEPTEPPAGTEPPAEGTTG